MSLAHLREDPAHFPESLKPREATYTRLPCPASPSNQPTYGFNCFPCRPMQKTVRQASGLSGVGGFIGERLSHLVPARSHFLDALNSGHCSGRRALRLLDPSAIADAGMQHSFPAIQGISCPFDPSLPRLWALLRKDRFGRVTSSQNGMIGDLSKVPGSYLRGILPLPNVTEQSDFPGGNHRALFCCAKNPVLRVSGTLRSTSVSERSQNT
jgi:hypothetical protein